jgi:hypothetical protein
MLSTACCIGLPAEHHEQAADRLRAPAAEGYISRALPLIGNLTHHGGTRLGVWPVGSTAHLFFALAESEWLPPQLRSLPVVEVGTNDGTDFALKVAAAAHGRLYCFEPTTNTYEKLAANLDRANITWVNSSRARHFLHMGPGSVLAYHAAVCI